MSMKKKKEYQTQIKNVEKKEFMLYFYMRYLPFIRITYTEKHHRSLSKHVAFHAHH